MALQIRRGTDTQRQALSGPSTPLIGELLYSTDNKKLHIGDGTTTGGTSIGYFGSVAVSGQGTIRSTGANEALTIVAGANISLVTDASTGTLTIAAAPQELNNGSLRLFQNNITSLNSNEDINIDPAGTGKVNVTGNLTATTLTGALTGNVTGNVTSTGNSSFNTITATGVITGAQVGNVIPFYYANQTAFPSASTYHGAIAHAHDTGRMYFAHGGTWNAIANTSDATSLNTVSKTVTRDATGNFAAGTITAALTGNVTGNVTGNLTGNVTSTSVTSESLNVSGVFSNQRIKIDENIISSLSSNENIEIEPSGTGQLILRSSMIADGLGLTFNPANSGILITSSMANKSSVATYHTTNNASLSTTFVVDAGLLSGVGTNVIGAPFTFIRGRGTPLLPLPLQSGDEINVFDFLGVDATTISTSAKMKVVVDGAVNAGTVPGRFDFLTTNLSGTQAVRLTVSSTEVASTVPVKLAVYADATARDAAVTSPTAGMVVFNTTGTKFQGYTGSAWVDLN